MQKNRQNRAVIEAGLTLVISIDESWTKPKNRSEQVLFSLKPEQPEVLFCSFAEVRQEPNQTIYWTNSLLVITQTPPTVDR